VRRRAKEGAELPSQFPSRLDRALSSALFSPHNAELDTGPDGFMQIIAVTSASLKWLRQFTRPDWLLN